MTRMSNWKKFKENSNSPQGRHSLGNNPANVPANVEPLLNSTIRPRSSSQPLLPGLIKELPSSLSVGGQNDAKRITIKMTTRKGSDNMTHSNILTDGMNGDVIRRENTPIRPIGITVTIESTESLLKLTHSNSMPELTESPSSDDASCGNANFSDSTNSFDKSSNSTDDDQAEHDDSWSDASSTENEDDHSDREMKNSLNFVPEFKEHKRPEKENTSILFPHSLVKNLRRSISGGGSQKKCTIKVQTPPTSLKCISAPHSPSTPPAYPGNVLMTNTFTTNSTSSIPTVFQVPRAEATNRSRSLEANVQPPKSDKDYLDVFGRKQKTLKQRLFNSTSGLNKPSLALSIAKPRKINPTETSSEQKETNDTTFRDLFHTRSASPKLRFLLPGSNLRVKSKGHVSATEEFYCKVSSNERNSVDNTTFKGQSVSTDATQPSGSLAVDSCLPLNVSSQLSGGSLDGTTGTDVVDGPAAVNEERYRQHAEHLKQKIIKTSEAIKREQSTRDENVAEYLKLATSADKQQASRIKSVFEKKNQKSSSNINQLQKKLDSYHRRLREIDTNSSWKHGRLRDVGANIRELSGGVVGSVKGGLSGLQQATQTAAGAIVSKPKDFAVKMKNRFGSADNLASFKDEEEEDVSLRYGSADEISITSGSNDNYPDQSTFRDDSSCQGRNFSSPLTNGPTNGDDLSGRVDHQQLHAVALQLITLKTELQDMREAESRIESEWDMWKTQMEQELNMLSSSLQDERFCYERLEVQLADLNEFHQREISSLKQELGSMEEKVEYHANERARDMQEAIESCQARVAKMELQQQQLVTVEGLENATARDLGGRLINLLLSVMTLLLLLVSTVSGFMRPLMRSQVRLFSTLVVIFASVVMYKNWDAISWWMRS